MDRCRRRQKNTIRRQLLDVAKGINCEPGSSNPAGSKEIPFHCLNALQEAREVKRLGHVFIGPQLENFVAISF